MNLIGLAWGALLALILSGVVGPRLPGCAHGGHHGRAPFVHAVAADSGGPLTVRSHHGRSHVRLGSGRHGLEVYSDERGNSRVRLGDAMRVETDERGGARVHLGDVAIDSDGSD